MILEFALVEGDLVIAARAPGISIAPLGSVVIWRREGEGFRRAGPIAATAGSRRYGGQLAALGPRVAFTDAGAAPGGGAFVHTFAREPDGVFRSTGSFVIADPVLIDDLAWFAESLLVLRPRVQPQGRVIERFVAGGAGFVLQESVPTGLALTLEVAGSLAVVWSGTVSQRQYEIYGAVRGPFRQLGVFPASDHGASTPVTGFDGGTGFAVGGGVVHAALASRTRLVVTPSPAGFGVRPTATVEVARDEGCAQGVFRVHHKGRAICEGAVVGGRVSCLFPPLAPGRYLLNADYFGDDGTAPSRSDTLLHIVE